MGEEWATRSTTVRYGRRRPGWPLDHHLLDRPSKISDGKRCALASDRTLHIAQACAHSPRESRARRPSSGQWSSGEDIFDGTSRGPWQRTLWLLIAMCMTRTVSRVRVRAFVLRTADRFASMLCRVHVRCRVLSPPPLFSFTERSDVRPHRMNHM